MSYDKTAANSSYPETMPRDAGFTDSQAEKRNYGSQRNAEFDPDVNRPLGTAGHASSGRGHDVAGTGLGSNAGNAYFGSTPRREASGNEYTTSNEYGTTHEHGKGRTGPGIGDKIKGSVEKTAGVATGNPNMQMRGEERRTQGTNY